MPARGGTAEESRPFRLATAVALGVSPLVVAGAALARGSAGALGAALGSLLAAAFFAVTLIAMRVARRRRPSQLPAIVGVSYLIKLVGVLVAGSAVRSAAGVDGRSFGVAVIIGVVVFLVAEIPFALSSQVPYVDPALARRRPAADPPQE